MGPARSGVLAGDPLGRDAPDRSHEGEIAWDTAANNFAWPGERVLPANLAKVYAEEPLYLDFRWAKKSDDVSLKNPAFLDAVANLAATLHGRSKDDMVGEDVRQHRRTRRIARVIGAALVILTLASVIGAYVAVQQRNEAERQRQEAERQRQVALARQLAAQAELVRTQQPIRLPRALLLAVESMKRFPSLEANQVLHRGLSLLARRMELLNHRNTVSRFAFSADRAHLVVETEDKNRVVWRTADGSDQTAAASTIQADLSIRNGRYEAITSPDRKYRIETTGRRRDPQRCERRDTRRVRS